MDDGGSPKTGRESSQGNTDRAEISFTREGKKRGCDEEKKRTEGLRHWHLTHFLLEFRKTF